MQNNPVKFRRGYKESLPTDIADGYLSIDAKEGQMYADIVDGETTKRLALNGNLFGVSDSEELVKTVDIVGVPEYFDGLIVTVIFTEIDKSSSDPLYLSIIHNDLVLPAVNLMSNEDTTISGVEIEPGVPYQFVYRNGLFVLNSGNVGSRPKWKSLTQNLGE